MFFVNSVGALHGSSSLFEAAVIVDDDPLDSVENDPRKPLVQVINTGGVRSALCTYRCSHQPEHV